MDAGQVIDFEAAKFWFDVLQFVITVVIAIYVWLVNRHRVTHGRISNLEKAVADQHTDHEKRLIKVENDIDHLPDHDDVSLLRQRMGAIEGDIKAVGADLRGIRELLDPMGRSMERINDYLLRVDKP